jgi:hypothetical protein
MYVFEIINMYICKYSIHMYVWMYVYIDIWMCSFVCIWMCVICKHVIQIYIPPLQFCSSFNENEWKQSWNFLYFTTTLTFEFFQKRNRNDLVQQQPELKKKIQSWGREVYENVNKGVLKFEVYENVQNRRMFEWPWRSVRPKRLVES